MKAKRLFLVISFLATQFMVSSVLGVFNYPNFSSIAGIGLEGDAIHITIPTEERIRLTSSPLEMQAGAAWYTTQVSVVSGWETVFEFQITGLDESTGADGLAFVIQNEKVSALGGAGGYIGYGSNGPPFSPGIYNSLAVEFDTWVNGSSLGDPDDNHISVQTRGTAENSPDHTHSLGATPEAALPYFSDGAVHTVKITYVPGTLTIFVDDLSLSNSVLVSSVDLGSTLDLPYGEAWVGFTAATGTSWENHDILSWSFVPEPATLSLLGLGSLVLLRKRRA